MCGFNALVRPEHRPYEMAQIKCPDCFAVGMHSFLAFGDELDDSIIEDDPMEYFEPTAPQRAEKGE
jgi:hypothetical protein